MKEENGESLLGSQLLLVEMQQEGFKPALAVSERYALRRHLELDNRGSGSGVTTQGGVCGLGYGLWAGQRFSFHGVQVKYVTGWKTRGKRRREGEAGSPIR